MVSPYTTALTPVSLMKRAYLQVNRPIFFRRALGADQRRHARQRRHRREPTLSGLTHHLGESDPHSRATGMRLRPPGELDDRAARGDLGDCRRRDAAVEQLGRRPFRSPRRTTPAPARVRTKQSYYRVAMLGRQGRRASRCRRSETGMKDVSVFGTDGGTHNFLRMLEQEAAPPASTVNYRVLDGDAVLQPPGDRHVQVLHGTRPTMSARQPATFRLRHRLRHAVTLPPLTADVPRHERRRLLAGVYGPASKHDVAASSGRAKARFAILLTDRPPAPSSIR